MKKIILATLMLLLPISFSYSNNTSDPSKELCKKYSSYDVVV